MRDLKVRYRQATVGVLWAILQPVSKLIIFSFIFSLLQAKPQSAASAAIPYALSALVGLIVWEFFGSVLRDGGEILVGQRSMLTKIYFPRILLPASVMVTAGLDFSVGLALALIWLVFLGKFVGWMFLVGLCYLVWLAVFSVSWGIILSCLNVLYRDIRFVIPLVLQIGFFASPVVYEYRALLKNQQYDLIAALNPMVTIIEGLRSSMLGTAAPTMMMVIVSGIITLFSVFLMLQTYVTIEQKMADNI
jgi:lipopolysaccharide transport system permease protein